MSQKIDIHKGKEKFPNSLWWRPFCDWQRQMNDALQSTSPTFMPSAFWNAENNIFSEIQKNTNEIFSQLFNNRQMFTPWIMGEQTKPYIDILENEKVFFVKADLPGIDAESINVSVSDRALIIKGESCQESSVENAHYIRRECCSGSFSRTIALPENADLDHAHATFRKNVLAVEIPKKSDMPAKARHVPVATSDSKHKKAA